MKSLTLFLLLFHLTCFSQKINLKTLSKKFWVTDQQSQDIETLFNKDTLKLTKESNYIPFFSSDNPQFNFQAKDLFTLVFAPIHKTFDNGAKGCNFKNECGKWIYNKQTNQITLSRYNTDSNTTDNSDTWVLKANYIYKVVNQTDSFILLVKQKP